MLLRRISPGNFVPWNGEPINGVQYPRVIEERFSDDELNSLELYRIKKTLVPEGKRVIATSYTKQGKFAKENHAYEDITYTRNDVNRERDNRIDLHILTHNGRNYQLRQQDRENIIGATLAATLAIIEGAQPGNTRWENANSDFTWILANNDIVVLDAHEMVELGKAAMGKKKELIYKARDVKILLESDATLDPSDNTLWD